MGRPAVHLPCFTSRTQSSHEIGQEKSLGPAVTPTSQQWECPWKVIHGRTYSMYFLHDQGIFTVCNPSEALMLRTLLTCGQV